MDVVNTPYCIVDVNAIKVPALILYYFNIFQSKIPTVLGSKFVSWRNSVSPGIMALNNSLLHIIPNDGSYDGIMQIKTSQRLSKKSLKENIVCFDLIERNGSSEALVISQNGAITRLSFGDEVSIH